MHILCYDNLSLSLSTEQVVCRLFIKWDLSAVFSHYVAMIMEY